MNDEPEEVYYIHSRRVHKGGSGCASLLVMLLGLVFLVLFWPVGILLIVIAFLCDSKYGRISFCGSCGNDVAPTSRLCPHCSVGLYRVPFSRWAIGFLWRGLVTAAVLGLVIAVASLFTANR